MDKFLLDCEINLKAPKNTSQVLKQIQNQFGKGVQIPVTFNAKGVSAGVAKITKDLKGLSTAAVSASNNFEKLGEDIARSLRRFSIFGVATIGIIKLSNALSNSVSEALDFSREMTKLQQVTGESEKRLKGISDEVSRLSIEFGYSSKEIIKTATTLAQAGLSAKDTKIALEALTKTGVAATFGDIKNTTEASIAIMNQFGKEAKDLEGILGSVNRVSAAFAVEAEDIGVAVRRAGSTFAAAGGNFNEFQALFTSVRQTTRASAESIATGLRTIEARLQRPRTQNFLSSLGIDLLDSKKQFVGLYESVARLSVALKNLPRTDQRFAQIAEELGGYRQLDKIIPLIERFDVTQKAYNVAIKAGNSLTEDAAIYQKSLGFQLQSVNEQFQLLIRNISSDEGFKVMTAGVLSLATAFIKLIDATRPFLPILALLSGAKIAKSIGPISKGFTREFVTGRSKYATGGTVHGPGTGTSDSILARVSKGEFIVNEKSAKKIGYGTLNSLNNGNIPKFSTGGIVGPDGLTPEDRRYIMMHPNTTQAQKLKKQAEEYKASLKESGQDPSSSTFRRPEHLSFIEKMKSPLFQKISEKHMANQKVIQSQEEKIQESLARPYAQKMMAEIENSLKKIKVDKVVVEATKLEVPKSGGYISRDEAVEKFGKRTKGGELHKTQGKKFHADVEAAAKAAGYDIQSQSRGLIVHPNASPLQFGFGNKPSGTYSVPHGLKDFKEKEKYKTLNSYEDFYAMVNDARDFGKKSVIGTEPYVPGINTVTNIGPKKKRRRKKKITPDDFVLSQFTGRPDEMEIDEAGLNALAAEQRGSNGLIVTSQSRKRAKRLGYNNRGAGTINGGSPERGLIPYTGLAKRPITPEIIDNRGKGFGNTYRGYPPIDVPFRNKNRDGLIVHPDYESRSFADMQHSRYEHGIGYGGKFTRPQEPKSAGNSFLNNPLAIGAVILATSELAGQFGETKGVLKEWTDILSNSTSKLLAVGAAYVAATSLLKDAGINIGGGGSKRSKIAGVAGGAAATLAGSALSHYGDRDIASGDDTSGARSIGGGFLSGAGGGAALGAAFGPYGIAIGAATGGLLGFTTALFDAKEKIQSVKIEKELETFAYKLKAVNSGGLSFAGNSDNIVNQIAAQRTQFNSSGVEAKQQIKAGINAQSSDIQDFFNAIAKESKSFDELDKKTQGTVSFFTNMTGIPFGDFRTQIEKTIEISKKKIDIDTKVNDALEVQGARVQAFNSLISGLSEADHSLHDFEHSIDLISSFASQNISNFKQTDFGSVFKQALDGHAGDKFFKANNAIGGNFGAPGELISKEAEESARIIKELPRLLTETRQEDALGRNGNFEQRLGKRLDSLNGGSGVSSGARNSVEAALSKLIGNDGTEQGLLDRIRFNVKDVADELAKEIGVAIDEVSKLEPSIKSHVAGLIHAFSEYNQAQDRIADLSLKQLHKQDDLADIRNDIYGNGRPLSLSTLQGRESRNAIQIGGSDNPKALAAELTKAQGRVRSIDDQLNNSQLDASSAKGLLEERAKSTQAAEKAAKALNYLAFESKSLSNIQKHIAEEQKIAQHRQSVAETLVFGSREEKRHAGETVAFAALAKSSGIQNVPAHKRRDVGEFLKSSEPLEYERIFREGLQNQGLGGKLSGQLVNGTSDKIDSLVGELTTAAKAQNDAAQLIKENIESQAGRIKEGLESANKSFLDRLEQIIKDSIDSRRKNELDNVTGSINANDQKLKSIEDIRKKYGSTGNVKEFNSLLVARKGILSESLNSKVNRDRALLDNAPDFRETVNQKTGAVTRYDINADKRSAIESGFAKEQESISKRLKENKEKISGTGINRDVYDSINHLDEVTKGLTKTFEELQGKTEEQIRDEQKKLLEKRDTLLGHAAGGVIHGPGTETSDSVLARLSKGEFVINAKDAKRIGYGTLNMLNKGKFPKFADGGLVSRIAAIEDPKKRAREFALYDQGKKIRANREAAEGLIKEKIASRRELAYNNMNTLDDVAGQETRQKVLARSKKHEELVDTHSKRFRKDALYRRSAGAYFNANEIMVAGESKRHRGTLKLNEQAEAAKEQEKSSFSAMGENTKAFHANDIGPTGELISDTVARHKARGEEDNFAKQQAPLAGSVFDNRGQGVTTAEVNKNLKADAERRKAVMGVKVYNIKNKLPLTQGISPEDVEKYGIGQKNPLPQFGPKTAKQSGVKSTKAKQNVEAAVSSGPSANKQVEQNKKNLANQEAGVQTSSVASAGSIKEFNDAVKRFSTSAEELTKALNNKKLEVTMNGKVEVIINGGEVISKIQGMLKEEVGNQIKQAISTYHDKNWRNKGAEEMKQ